MERRLQILEGISQVFTREEFPDLICGACQIGHLTPEPDAFDSQESVSSTKSRDHEYWEPDWCSGTFTDRLRCSRASCREVTLAAGTWRLSYEQDWDAYVEYFKLDYLQPLLKLVTAPEGTPRAVSKALVAVGSLALIDPASAVTRLRFALERLMDELAVPASSQSGAPIPLAARLEQFMTQSVQAKDFFDALRWLGNEATHTGSTTMRDLADACDMIEEGLRVLYGAQSREDRMREINLQKGSTNTIE